MGRQNNDHGPLFYETYGTRSASASGAERCTMLAPCMTFGWGHHMRIRKESWRENCANNISAVICVDYYSACLYLLVF